MPKERQGRRTVSMMAATYRKLTVLHERTGVPRSAIVERLLAATFEGANIEDPGPRPAVAKPVTSEQIAGQHFTF